MSVARSAWIVPAVMTAIVLSCVLARPSLAQDISEPNDSIDTAKGPLAPATTYEARSDDKDEEGDDDWYFFGVGGPATVRITLANTSACALGPDGCNLRAFLADGRGNALVAPGPRVSTIGPPEGVRAGTTATLEWNLPTAGTYTIKVGAPDAGFTYTLRVDGPLTTAAVARPVAPVVPPSARGDARSPAAVRAAGRRCRDLAAELRDGERDRTIARGDLKRHATLRKASRRSSDRRRFAAAVARDRQRVHDANGRIRSTLTLMRRAGCVCGYVPRDIRRDEKVRARHRATLSRHAAQRRRAHGSRARARYRRLVRTDLRRIAADNGRIRAHLARLRAGGCTCELKNRQLGIAQQRLRRSIAARNRYARRSHRAGRRAPAQRRRASRRVARDRRAVARLEREKARITGCA